jgi:hypothetical protein
MRICIGLAGEVKRATSRCVDFLGYAELDKIARRGPVPLPLMTLVPNWQD